MEKEKAEKLIKMMREWSDSRSSVIKAGNEPVWKGDRKYRIACRHRDYRYAKIDMS